ncbi:DUF5658 family protein [Clostridium paridis]|uniref:DUF5658 domain-containing protein n=1 Tax=Clostridium paridis TaxID=2803863 RepID=A0A937FGQ5_9CLOT|nr:hypothetical protein [Clostridium paridis]
MEIINRYKGISYIKRKFIFLFILNIIDLFFTWIVLFTNGEYFSEVNLVMSKIIYNIPQAFVIKIGGVGLVIFYWYYRLRGSNEKEILLSNKVLNFLIVAFCIITFVHLFNLGLCFYINRS